VKRIGFSHHYPKIHGQSKANLIAVHTLKGCEITDQLLEYDTTFVDDDGSIGRFPLKRTGSYIQLFFVGEFRIPFCTIRPAWPPEKVEYYRSSIGETFEVHYKAEGGAK